MKSIKRLVSVVLVATLTLSFIPAQAFADDPPVSTVLTGQAECINSDTVVITLSEFNLSENVLEFGIEVAIDEDFSDSVNHTGTGSGSFFFISGLSAETTYYYRAYLRDNSTNTYYGTTQIFTTPAKMPEGTIRDSKKSMISDTAYINALLKPYGIDASQLVSLPEKEPGFYEELAQYANISDQTGALNFESMPAQSAAPSPSAVDEISSEVELLQLNSPEGAQSLSQTSAPAEELRGSVDLFGSRFEYACYIAGINKNGDSAANTYEDEVVYMYLSHYIDIQPRDLGTTVDFNSNNYKYSAWITLYDREVYDSYLRTANLLNTADAMRGAASGLAGLFGSVTEIAGAAKVLRQSANTLKVITTTVAVGDASGQALDIGTSFRTLRDGLSGNQSPEQVVNAVRSSLAGHDYSAETVDFIVSSTISIALAVAIGTLFVAPPVGLLVSAAVFAVNVVSMAYLDISQGVAWLGMQQSFSGRLPGRILRFYGMW